MTGYTRNDTADNIADGNIINASDLDGEFDAVQNAFDSTTGHKHDGTAGEGAPIEKVGPAQDVVITTSAMRPKSDNVVDLGTSLLEYKDLFIDGTAHIDTLDVDETATFTGTSTFNDDVTLTGAAYNVVWDKTDNALEFGDNAKATFGAGADLQIYHDGSNSYIDETGTGTLRIRGYNQVRITDTSDNIAAIFKGDAETTLYHNNSIKLATTSTGISVTGDVDASDDLILSSDSSKILFGTDGDIQLVHNPDAGLILENNNTADNNNFVLTLQSNEDTLTVGEQIARINFSSNPVAGGVSTGAQASIRVEATGTYSATVAGTNMEFYTTKTDGTLSRAMYIDDEQSVHFTGGTNVVLNATNNTLDIPDNFKIMVGTGSDLQIYHDGSHSYIDEAGAGDIYVSVLDDIIFRTYGTNEIVARFNTNQSTGGWARLYHRGSEKLETTATGVDITGTLTSGDLTVDDKVFVEGSNPYIAINDTDVTDLNTMLRTQSGVGYINTINDAYNSVTNRFSIDHSTGDISFYEDTGTTAKFFWDASAERLGIGTTSPSNIIETDVSDAAVYNGSASLGSSSSLRILNSSATTGSYSALKLDSSNVNGNVGQWRIISISTATNFKNELAFATRTGSSGYAERMRITNAGNVGIGTSSPASTASLHIQGSDGASGSSVNTAANEFFIDNNGNTGMTLGSATTGTGYYAFADSDIALRAGIFYDHSTDDMGFRVASAERMRIDSDGNVGIGTDSGTALSTKLTALNDVSILTQLGSPNNTDGGALLLGASGSTGVATQAKIQAHRKDNQYTGDLSFSVGTGSSIEEAMRIDSSGNLLVGTTSTAISNEGAVIFPSGVMTITNDGGRPLRLNRKTSDGDILQFDQDGAPVGSIGSIGGVVSYMVLDPRSGGVGLSGTTGTGGAILPTSNAGAVNNGVVSLGEPAYRFKDLYLSGGVYLGGTGSANKLDDYEEGTWLVEMYDAASGGNASTTQVTGMYTKIGRQVIASFDALNNIDTSGMTADNPVYITLPFAASSTGRACGSCQLDNVTFPSSGTMVTPSVGDSSSRATLNTSGSATADTTVKVSDFNGTSSDIVNWTLSYRTAL